MTFSKENEWKGFDYKTIGITSKEFDDVKAAGISRAKLMNLLEVGIMPSEYLSSPWKGLGVSESEWYKAKQQGFEDDDIDRSIYTRTRFNYTPVLAFFLPGYYNYGIKDYKKGGIMTAVALTGVTLFALNRDDTAAKALQPKWLVLTLGAMIWSGFEGYLGTRFTHNRGAERFSFSFIPSNEPQAMFHFKF